MKKDIHPKVHPVVFVDPNGTEFVTTSTLTSEKTKKIDGVDHYIISIEISSASHPFYTGKKRLIDTAGRVDKFLERQKKSEEMKAAGAKKKKRRKKSIFEFDLSEDDIVEEKGSVKTNKKKDAPKAEEKTEAPQTEATPEAPVTEEKAEAPATDESKEEA